MPSTLAVIQANTIKTTHGYGNIPGNKNFSSSNPDSRATFVKSQDQEDPTGKTCEEESELHEEEAEEIHGVYFPSFPSESSDAMATELEGVPKISETLGEKLKRKRIVVSNAGSETKTSKTKSKAAGKKVSNQDSSEELKAAAIELEKKKEIAYRFSLKSYLTMCMQQDMVYKAMILLRNYHAEEKHFKSSLVYDAVLREASSRCSWKLIKEVVLMMEQGEIPFSLDSFAACFICLGRRSEKEVNLEVLSDNLLDKMDSCRLNVEDIFTICKFTGNHRELATKGVKLAMPDYQPGFPSVPLTYTTPLLTALNDMAVESEITSNVQGLLTEEKYYVYSYNFILLF